METGEGHEVKLEMVEIPKAQYEQLLDDQLLLTALQEGGVDNWDWYGEAIDLYNEWKTKESKNGATKNK